jgi:4-hydroxy-2-oxoglutarate aldolase
LTVRPIAGVFAPITTPFAGGELDRRGLDANIRRYLASTLDGLVLLGSNGEEPLLDEGECDTVIEIARAAMPRDRWLVAGTGHESTRATIAATRRAAATGADLALVRTPSFFTEAMTDAAFVAHYEAVADAAPIPILLYNVTVFTGVSLTKDAVARLWHHPNIAGLKDSTSDVGAIAELVADAPPGFAILAGSSPGFHACLCAGAVGAVLGSAAVCPDLHTELVACVRQGHHDAARAIQARLMPLSRLIGPRYGVAGLKKAVELAGYASGPPRLPLLPVPDEALPEFADALAAVGIDVRQREERDP